MRSGFGHKGIPAKSKTRIKRHLKEACSLDDLKTTPSILRIEPEERERKREKFISVRGNSIVKILNFLREGSPLGRSRATKRVTLFTSTSFLTRASVPLLISFLFFLSLSLSLSLSLVSRG